MAKRITLTDAEYDILLQELGSLGGYHWNDDRIHADDCGSKVLGVVELKTEDVAQEEDLSDYVVSPECRADPHSLDQFQLQR